MGSLGWTLIQYDWYTSRKRKPEHKNIQKKDNVKTQGEDSYGHLHTSLCMDIRIHFSWINT